jgi:hypothetical protein
MTQDSEPWKSPAIGKARAAVRWLSPALLLTVVFLIVTQEILKGTCVQLWDAWSFYTPAFSLVADHARSGRLLLWDPWLAAGTPDFADPQVGAASPIAIIVGLIGGGTGAAFRAYWLLIWLLGPLGLLVLAKHLNAPPWAAVSVALGYAFCGFYTAHAEHTTVIYSFSFIPWFIWRFDVALASGRFKPAAQAGAVWGLSALGGYPAIVILSGGMLFLWGMGRCFGGNSEAGMLRPSPVWARLRFTFFALIIAFCVGVMVLAPTYVAFFKEGLGYTERAGAMPRVLATGAIFNALNPGALATFASPYLTALKFPFLNPGFWKGSDVSVADVYIGVLPLILSLLAVCQQPRSGWRWCLVAIIAFFLACAVGDRLPVRGWLYDLCPPTRYFTHSGMFRAYAIFSAAVLALLATRDLAAAVRKPETRIWRQLVLISLVTAAAAACAYEYVIHHVANVGTQLSLSNWHLVVTWSGAVAVSLFLLLFQRARRLFAFLFLLLAIFDASLTLELSQKFVCDRGRTRSLLKQADKGHKAALSLSSLQRELQPPAPLGGSHSNSTATLRVATFYNDSTMKNRFHHGFMDHPVLLNMGLGADRIWFAKDVAIAPPSNFVFVALANRSRELGAPVIVVHPAAQMAKISEISSPETPNRAELNTISHLPPAEKIPAQVLKYSPCDLTLKVSSPADGWLLVTDRWAAGWRAKVNGVPVKVFGGNFIFRAVQLKAGENTIDFYYPQPLYLALVLLSWGTLVAVLAVPAWKTRRTTRLPNQSVANGDAKEQALFE